MEIDLTHQIIEAKEKKTLNKPFRTPNGPKKFSVYVKNEKGNIVKVNFGDPNMEIKRDDPDRRKNFRARHNCDNPGPKTKARYWSCYQWRAGTKVKGSEGDWDGETFYNFDELLTINPALAFVEEEVTEDDDCQCGGNCGCSEEESEAALTSKQKKLPPALQKAILKKQGKKSDKDEEDKDEKEDDKDEEKNKDKDDTPTKGLTNKQKKLPPALQKAILKRQGKAADCDMSEDLQEKYASLWKNIQKKRERIKSGSGEKMRKKGDKGAPTPEQLKKAKGEKKIKVNPEGTGPYEVKEEFKASYEMSLEEYREVMTIEDEIQCKDHLNELDFESSAAKRRGPKSAAQTPAAPSERKKGSSKNPKGSASKSGSSIKFSEKVINSLKNKVKEHNSKHKKKVTLPQLKKVYRRGAGAFSQSHRPNMNRGGWAMARVNMFLKMKRGGKVKQSYRAADGDL
jgi:hypothetical protein